MNLEVLQNDDELTRLKLSGRLDLAGVQEIQSKFYGYTAARKKPTLVDFSEVTFLASLGIRLVLQNAKAQTARGGKMVLLVTDHSVVAETLRTTGTSPLERNCKSRQGNNGRASEQSRKTRTC
jgi:anti-anti-sigma factor